jgi:hypothetical protein
MHQKQPPTEQTHHQHNVIAHSFHGEVASDDDVSVVVAGSGRGSGVVFSGLDWTSDTDASPDAFSPPSEAEASDDDVNTHCFLVWSQEYSGRQLRSCSQR